MATSYLCLDGRNALVTGAASGIGFATAVEYANQGVAGLCLLDIAEEKLQKCCEKVKEAAKSPSIKVISRVVNIISEEAVNAAVEDAKQQFGRIDIAALIAGALESPAPEALLDVKASTYDFAFNLNAKGLFLCLRAVLKIMNAQDLIQTLPGRASTRGNIVALASEAGVRCFPGHAPYTAAKHAAVAFVKNAAHDCSGTGIRVNAVCPGLVNTPLVDSIKEARPETAAFWDAAAHTYVKRLAEPAEVVDAVMFLSSQRSSYITGLAWVLDGGHL